MFIFECESLLGFCVILNREARLMPGNARCHCFLLLVGKEGRKEGCLLESSVLSLHSQNAITDLYITFENTVIIVESNCCVGVVSSWRHFMDGDLQCVMFLPISHL